MDAPVASVCLTPAAARERLPELQAQLATRASTLEFAHTGVSLVACVILTIAAGKLFWDSVRFPVLGAVASAMALGLAIYAWLRYRRGMRALGRELALYASLREVHRVLHLDDPGALLPR